MQKVEFITRGGFSFISLQGLDKALVLAALYNAAKPRGLSAAQYKPDHTMTIEEARNILKAQKSFDYFQGRALKVDLSREDLFDHEP